jgi:hypothetical protein
MSALGYIGNSTTFSNIEVTGESKVANEVSVTNTGTAANSTTIVENGDAINHLTEITFSNTSTMTVSGAGAQAYNMHIYDFPTGRAIEINSVLSQLAMTASGGASGDTPEVAIGTAAATSAAATITTPAEENVLAGATQALTGIASERPDVPHVASIQDQTSLYLNAATTWTSGDTITASGKIVVSWTDLGPLL